jgi:hypothetical protein
VTIIVDGFYIVHQEDSRFLGTGMLLGCTIVKFHCLPDCNYHYAKWSGTEDILDILPGKSMYLADSWSKAIKKIGFNLKKCPEPK